MDAPNDALTHAHDIISRLQLRHYAGEYAEDMILLHWWMDMHESGELQTMMPLHGQPLGAFVSQFRHGNILVYSAHPDKLWFAFWFEPCFNGRAAWVSNWCAPDKRGSRDQYDATWAMHTYLFAAYPVLLAMSKQPRVIDELAKLGYNNIATLPKLFDVENDATIATATHASFLASKFNSIRSQ